MKSESKFKPKSESRISVAMCTYNGERFLPEQLASIVQQTRSPDELIVCDDRSTDRTLTVLRDFAASVSFPVRIFVNEHNLGVSANFEGAIRRCKGDLIALSDQDDIWYPTRLEMSAWTLDCERDIGLVFTDADLIDANGQLLDQTIWKRLRFAGKPLHDLLAGQWTVLAKQRFVTGATVMFRSSLRESSLPVGAGWVHDEWIAMTAAAFSRLGPIEQALIRYRIHGSQQVGFTNKLQKRAKEESEANQHWRRVAESAKELRELCDFLAAAGVDPGNAVLQAYQEHLRFLEFRANLPPGRLARMGSILRRYPQYEAHASGAASALKDLSLARRG
jgi:Glycosyl transferase family 2